MANHVNLSAQDAAAVEEFVRRVREAVGTNLITLKLFGSKARGQDVQDSDIDVLVVVRDDRVAAEDLVLDIAFEVNVPHGVYISPRVVTAAMLADPVWRSTAFVHAVEREGVPL
jgi:predicted nucleotidyltransferase